MSVAEPGLTVAGTLLWGVPLALALLALVWPLRFRLQFEGQVPSLRDRGSEQRVLRPENRAALDTVAGQGRLLASLVVWGPLALTLRLPGAAGPHGPAAGGEAKPRVDAGQGANGARQNNLAGKGFERTMANIAVGVEVVHSLLGSEPWRNRRGELHRSPLLVLAVSIVGLPLLAVGRGIRQCESFSWTTAIGSGDAYVTSLAAGALWGAKGAAIALLSRRLTFSTPPRLLVIPDYETHRFAISLHCIFRFTLGHIIVAIVRRALARWRGDTKG